MIKETDMDTPQIKKCKNLVYLMLKRYKTSWRSSFPRDMGIPIEKCERMYELYAKEVAEEIDRERSELMGLGEEYVPSLEDMNVMAIKRIHQIISTCEDPAKIANTLKILEDLKSRNSIVTEKKTSLFDKLNTAEDEDTDTTTEVDNKNDD